MAKAKTIKYPELASELARRGLTQKELAQYLGVNQGTISKKMAGKTEWTIGEIDTICDYFGKDYYQLFK